MLLKPEEVARRLAITDTQVYRLIKAGSIPAIILPDMKQYRIAASDLSTWVRSLPRKVVEDMEKAS